MSQIEEAINPAMNGQRIHRGRRGLTAQVTDLLRDRILDGKVKPGEKLPTEKALVEEFRVSRTVIREAVAALRADGLLKARQGAGVYVLEPPPSRNLGLGMLTEDLDRISTILEALELRAAVEIEAASLAAMRRAPAQEAKIREAYGQISACLERNDDTAGADFAFHLAIADATNNRYYREFLQFLGHRTIPRAQFATKDGLQPAPPARLRLFQEEHQQILEAITRQDAEAARRAMRQHLRGSIERYSALVRAAG